MLEQNEHISALMDGELNAEEDIQRVISHMQVDEKMRRCWEHYHLIGDALKKNLPNSYQRNLAGHVSQALQDLPPHSAPASSIPSTPAFRYKSLTGFALAASAGVIAFLGVGALEPQSSPPQTQFLSAAAGSSIIPMQTTGQPPAFSLSQVQPAKKRTHWDVAHPAVESKLNDYLANHEFSASSSAMQRGMPPYVRIVGYEPNQQSQ